jgi:hypothetical protein
MLPTSIFHFARPTNKAVRVHEAAALADSQRINYEIRAAMEALPCRRVCAIASRLAKPAGRPSAVSAIL